MAAGDRCLAATLLVLILVFALVASASGLQSLPDEETRVYRKPEELWNPIGDVIVIDLGNTNSCVAGKTDDNTIFQFCIPSWVAFTDNGTTLVGEAAKNHAGADPEATVYGFKRLLGLRRNRLYHEDIVQGAIERVHYKIGTRGYDTTVVEVKAKDGSVKHLGFYEVASTVVAELKGKAEEHLGRTVRYAVMTIPQHFAQAHRMAAVNAGKMAGLDVWTVTEPTAIAEAYGLRSKLRERGTALVLRVGGGTSDASVLVRLDGELEVFEYWDENFLGGDDFDNRVVDYFAKLIEMKHGVHISKDTVGLAKLRAACENAKKALSSQDHVQVTVDSLVDGVDFSEPLSRLKFDQLNDDMFRKVMDLMELVMVRAGLDKNKNRINEIVLVGGSAMIPKIQRLVKDYFNGREPNIRVKPNEAIAHGATVYIHSLLEKSPLEWRFRRY